MHVPSLQYRGASALFSTNHTYTNRMDLCQSIESEIGHWCMCSVCRTTSAMKLKTTAVAVSCGDHTLELFGGTRKVHRINNDRVVRVPAPTTCGRRQRGSYLILNVCAVCVRRRRLLILIAATCIRDMDHVRTRFGSGFVLQSLFIVSFTAFCRPKGERYHSLLLLCAILRLSTTVATERFLVFIVLS